MMVLAFAVGLLGLPLERGGCNPRFVRLGYSQGMSILKIARLGHPILRMKAEAVLPDELGSLELFHLVDDMMETMEDADGAGLAAPQVHVSKRVVVLYLDPDEPAQVWINPVITPTTDQPFGTFEGCLSVPGMRGLVVRPSAVQVTGFLPNGDPFDVSLSGFPAVVAQHECDHLDGILYVDRVVPKTLSFVAEYERFVLAADEEEGAEEESS